MADELAAARWARWVPPVIALAAVLTGLALGPVFEEFRDFLEEAFDAADAGSTPPPVPATSAVNLIGAVNLGALVALWVWQYRAATAARALGLPAVRSPAMGVGGWLIPVVNFWFPYQALRDCLPPGHPERGLVLRWWLAYLLTYALVPGTAVALAFGPPALAVAAVVVLVAVGAWVGWAGHRMVDAISSDHARATAGLGDNPT